MTTKSDMSTGVLHLEEQECWERLRATPVGRLAFEAGGAIRIVPINYTVRDRTLVLRTHEHAALLEPQRMPVSLEVDDWTRHEAWSVVVGGDLYRNDDPAVLSREQGSGGGPWAPNDGAPRTTVVELEVQEISGRRFERFFERNATWYW